MPHHAPLSGAEIGRQLDEILEVEFSFLHTESVAAALAVLPREQQELVLDWTRRVASTNIQLAFEFAQRAEQALAKMDPEMISAWCLHAMDSYDRSGLFPAMAVIKDLQGFVSFGLQRASASLLESAEPVLRPFIQGLSGRTLKIEEDSLAWTDGDNLYLPEMVARFDSEEENFQLYKAIATHLWAQTRFGTLNIDPGELLRPYADHKRALSWFQLLETQRLDGQLQRELPGLYRQMCGLADKLEEPGWPDELSAARQALQNAGADASVSRLLLAELYEREPPPPPCYAGGLDLFKAWEARQLRLLRDKARFRDTLRVIAEELTDEAADTPPASFELREKGRSESDELPQLDLVYADQVLPPPESLKEMMTSIQLDLSGIPEEYLVPAGPGEHDPSLLEDMSLDPDDVWGGTYHEEGAFFYDEWDFGRQSYRKRWCVLREVDIQPGESGFYARTLSKYQGLVKSLRRTFEVLRGEDKTLRRQPHGEDVDIDAFVEAWADVHSGLEMNDRLFTRTHKDERDIAVLFMVDMSGSTKGWINEAEREALVLLVESLEILGDRYAIYGFSGWARKRCEAYRIKTFDQPMDDSIKSAIAGIEPRDYTRMGAPIRHFVQMLAEVEARTKLLITLSDGKPDDYDHYYRGEYGIEDTRLALFEARVAGIHPFCITIDREGADYLPHMYGKANYVVIDEVTKLPLKVSDIYRKITS